MDRNKPGYMNFDDIADRLESGKLNAYDVVYTKDTHEVVFIKEDLSLIRMKCRLDVYPSVVVAEYYLNLNTDTYVGQIVGIEQGEWICLYNVNYADNKFIVRKVGVDEYGQLANKPQINGVTLEGNKTTEQLGINIPTRFSQLYDDIGYVTFDHLIENYYSKSQTYSKSEVDTALVGKADTNDIPTDLADLQDDSTHRTVTDEDIAVWNAKSNVVANPVETTGALTSIEIDGVSYAVSGSGGGAVNSVNGKTGNVMLDASDVGALPDDTTIPSHLSDLDEDSTHRVVTDAEKVAWNNKSNFSGSYRDLTDQPTIPSDLSQLNDDTTHRVVTDTEKNTWNNKSDFSGSYNDLTDQPTIPTVNNPTITIQKNGQSVDSFTLNQSGNKSINIVVPTKTSDLSNDSNFINSTVNNLANYYLKTQTYTQAEVDALIDAAINGRFRKVNALPVTGEPNIIYLVPKVDPETSDACDEYIWQDNAWELIGNTNIDLSGYVTDEELTIALADYLTISVFSTTIANYYNKTEIGALLDDKVDKVDGKGLSTYDYDAAAKAIVDSVTANLANKVDKVTGKGLSTNDYDAIAKGKVDALGTASTKNVPTSGNAGASEVVMGNDTRLSDARNAADVYAWAKADTKPSYTKSEVGLGNVDNTSDTTKKVNFTGAIASDNTGFVTGGDTYAELNKKVDKVDGKALSSNDYTDTDKGRVDALGTASTKDVSTSGNASTSQVVMGSDTRLSDARPASDVSAWAKEATKPSYSYSEITNTPTLGTAAAKDVPSSGDAGTTEVVMGNDTRLTDSRNAKDVYAWAKESTKPSYSYSEINNTPTLGTASALDVATSGDASSTQVVKGDDSRLSDARTPISHTHTLSEITDAGTAASKNSTSSVTADSTDLVESGAVYKAINDALDYKFDGTKKMYVTQMKRWFREHNANKCTTAELTALCEEWYKFTKQGWKGGTSFPAVGVSTGSTGTRFDDNVGMSVTPSTDTSANTDTYQGLPLFAITDCNWELDSDGNILITAIDGITDNFARNDPTKFVGVMQQTGWVKKVDDATTQKYYYADDKNAYPDLVPLPEAIKLDGTVRSFVVHAKYMSGIVDSKMTCCSGVIPRRNISHNSLVTLPDNIGAQYSGGTSVDWSFLVWMQRIKYASLTSDGILQGCCNYNYQYYVKVGEADVKRLILASNQGGNLKVGSTITFGAYAGNADRGNSGTYSISGQDGAIITSIEDVTIDGTTYKAVYVNTENTFTTVANGDATNGTTIVSTHHWVSGSCDNVKGNDGSPVSATNGIYPAKLQGIEYMVGGYEIFADVIMNISDGYYNPYYARKSTEQATSITSSMVQSTLKCAQPSSDAWRYIQKHGFDGEIFYPILTGTSSSEYMKDAFYENGTGTTTGTREWLGFGHLTYGSGHGGLSCLAGDHVLSFGGWCFVARLSCNGNRGILLTA